jgi:hypothetical protein
MPYMPAPGYSPGTDNPTADFLTNASRAGLTGADLSGLNTLSKTTGISAADLAKYSQNPLISALIGQEAPAIAQYGQQYAAAEGQLGALPAGQAVQNALLQGSTNLQGAQLQNQAAGNVLQQQNVAQQLGIAGGQNQLAQQLAGIQQGQLNYNLPIAQAQARAQGAISGTLGTQGYQQKYGQIGEQYQVSSAELANQLAGQNLSYQGQQLSSANQIAQLQNTAKSLGISEQQLQNQLSAGTFQIAQQTGQQQDTLMQQATQALAGQAQGQGALLSNIGAITGLGPQALKPPSKTG